MINMGNCKSGSVGKEGNVPIVYFSHHIDLKIQDSNGNDLLNPEFAAHYGLNDISVYESDYAHNAVYIAKNTPYKDYYLKLSLKLPELKNVSKEEYMVTTNTKVKFGNNIADKVKGLFEVKYHKGVDEEGDGTSSGYTIILQKAWFNDKLVFNIEEAENTPDLELPVIQKELNI